MVLGTKSDSAQGRHERVFAVSGEWYFATREGESVGPFEQKGTAENGLKDFVDCIAVAEPTIRSALDSNTR